MSDAATRALEVLPLCRWFAKRAVSRGLLIASEYDDAVQELYLAAVVAMLRYDETKGKFSTYFRRPAWRTIRGLIRARRRALGSEVGPLRDEIHLDSIPERIDASGLVGGLAPRLAALSPRQADAIRLSFNGYGPLHIGRSMGISHTAAAKLVAKGTRNLAAGAA